MMRGLLTQMSTKMAAGALGAVLALGTLGAAGVGPVGLIGHDDEPDHDCVPLNELSTTFDEDIVVCDVSTDDDPVSDDGEDVEDEGDDLAEDDSAEGTADEDGATATEAGTDELPPLPTTTSEAAKIHAFDEACGNHGMYVSFFAQMGFEPPCALLVRDGGELDPDTTRQERKKAALQQRKACKAKAKSGTPCRPEDFAVTDLEAQEEAPPVTTTETATNVEDDSSATTTEQVAETEEPREDEGSDRPKEKGDQRSKGDGKSKGDQRSKSPSAGKGAKPKK